MSLIFGRGSFHGFNPEIEVGYGFCESVLKSLAFYARFAIVILHVSETKIDMMRQRQR